MPRRKPESWRRSGGSQGATSRPSKTSSPWECSTTRHSWGWRAREGESFLDPQPGEIVVFIDFFKQGFGVPVHPFLQGRYLYYEIGICNLHPNSILLVSTFIHLCEAYGGFQPHFDLFRHLLCLRKKGSGGSKIAGGVYLNLRDGMKA